MKTGQKMVKMLCNHIQFYPFHVATSLKHPKKNLGIGKPIADSTLGRLGVLLGMYTMYVL